MGKTIALASMVTLIYSCSGPQPKQADEPFLLSDDDPVERSAEKPTEPKEAEEPETDSSLPPPVPEDWTLSFRDCQLFHGIYRRLLRTEEMEKLNKRKLNEKQRAAGLKNVEKVVKQGADQWMDACKEIVDTMQLRPRWECAEKADTAERFKACLDGTHDQELTKQ